MTRISKPPSCTSDRPPRSFPDRLSEEESRIAARFGIDVDVLPRGFLVGTVEIVGSRPVAKSEAACFGINDGAGFYAWVLDRPKRAQVLEKPTRQPQPMFFNPF